MKGIAIEAAECGQTPRGKVTPATLRRSDCGMIPRDWECCLVDSVAKRGSGHTPDKSHPEYWNGTIKWVSLADSDRLDRLYISETTATITAAGIENSSAVVHPKGTVILSRDAGVGKSAICQDDMAVSQHFMAWICGPRLDNHFLYYWLQATKREFERIATGNTIKTIGLPYFRLLKIPLPSLCEQRAIARALSDADALIAALDHLIAKHRAMKQGAMQQLLTGRTRLPGFVGKWPERKLGTLLSFVRSAHNPRGDLMNSGGVEYLHYGDVHAQQSPIIDCGTADLPWIDEAKVTAIPRLADGDLVLVDASEDLEGIGKSVEIANVADHSVVAGLHTIVARGEPGWWAPGFKGQLQFIPQFKNALERIATGISVYAISKSQIAGIELRLPLVEEQEAIVRVLSDMHAEIIALERGRTKIAAIKQGMMQSLLTGRVRLMKPSETRKASA